MRADRKLECARGAAILLAAVSLAVLSGTHAGLARTPSHHTVAKATHAAPKHGTRHAAATQRSAGGARNAPVAEAPKPAKPLIVIDPGHGGQDPGAIGVSGTREKTVTLAAAQELRRSLERTGRYRVALTRSGDRSMSLAARLAFAGRHDADLLISIHADASSDRSARGASVYVGSRDLTRHFAANRGSSHEIARALAATAPVAVPGSGWLQYSMIEQLADDVRMTAAPARQAQLYVLSSRTIPGVLLEMGFLSNREDEALLKQPARRQILVQAITEAIDDYFAGIRDSASRT
jgi:N-acetylmuramoyl-L-alanine amidase